MTTVVVTGNHEQWVVYVYDGKTDVVHWPVLPTRPADNGTPIDDAALRATKQAAATQVAAGGQGKPVGTAADDAALRATKQAMATQYASGGGPTKVAGSAGNGTPADWSSADATKSAAMVATEMAGGGDAPPSRSNVPGPVWDPSQVNPPSSLAELLKLVSSLGCGTAERLEEVAVAGRATYVVSVISTGTCPKSGDAGARLVVRADQQTFLTLGFEQYAADGSRVSSFEVNSVEFGLVIPDNTFVYTPPADAYICDANGSGGNPCRTKGPQRRGNP
jgi:hypothetical protein